MDPCVTYLHTENGSTIPVRVLTSKEGKTLFECSDPLPFLEHITAGRWKPPLSPQTYLRGVLIPSQGATFSLLDPFGVVADEVVKLSDQEAHSRLLDALW
jgi:hypothetical protein